MKKFIVTLLVVIAVALLTYVIFFKEDNSWKKYPLDTIPDALQDLSKGVLKKYTNDELGFSFSYPEGYGDITPIPGSKTIVYNGEKGKGFFGSFSNLPFSVLYFGGYSPDFLQSSEPIEGLYKGTECASVPNKITTQGTRYQYDTFTGSEINSYPDRTYYVATFSINKPPFHCLSFVAPSRDNFGSGDFLTIVNTIKVF